MRKVVAAINVSLDGIFDHTAMTANEEMHKHYQDLLDSGDVILYGRTTYQLMEFWPSLVDKPSGNKSMDDFAMAIDRIPKIVFSRTLKNVTWKSARLAEKDLKEEVLELKQQTGKDILVGSRSLIVALLNLDLVDEFQLCVHPAIIGNGLRLLEDVRERIDLKLRSTKTLSSLGLVVLCYEPIKRV